MPTPPAHIHLLKCHSHCPMGSPRSACLHQVPEYSNVSSSCDVHLLCSLQHHHHHARSWSDLTGLTCGSHRSDRCGQSQQNAIFTSPLDRSHRVDQDSYVERPNRSPDERDMPSGRSARPASHTGLTGAPDRCS